MRFEDQLLPEAGCPLRQHPCAQSVLPFALQELLAGNQGESERRLCGCALGRCRYRRSPKTEPCCQRAPTFEAGRRARFACCPFSHWSQTRRCRTRSRRFSATGMWRCTFSTSSPTSHKPVSSYVDIIISIYRHTMMFLYLYICMCSYAMESRNSSTTAR